jgi:hypothetical protein
MIENTMTYELRPNLDQQAYGEWAKKTIGVILQTPGVVEFRANRNLLGSPQVRATTVFQTLVDWSKFIDTDEWRTIEEELRAFATDILVEVWGPSPVLPEPVRPSQ